VKELLDNPNFVALVSAIFGGAGLKLIESWLSRAKVRADQGTVIREELRKEIDGLRSQLDKADAEEQRLEKQVEEWREKYWALREEKQSVVTELTIVMERLKAYERAIAKDHLDNSPTN
jgi:chromosome segregation ATPase